MLLKFPKGEPGRRRVIAVIRAGRRQNFPGKTQVQDYNLPVSPGDRIIVKDDLEIIYDEVWQPRIEAPPTPPCGEPPAPEVAPAAEPEPEMTVQEKLAAGYKPVNVDGKVVWKK